MSRRSPEVPCVKTVCSPGLAKRLEIDVIPTEVEAIRQITAVTAQTTLAAVMRDAVKAYVWLMNEPQQRRRVISEDLNGGNQRELLPVRVVTLTLPGKQS